MTSKLENLEKGSAKLTIEVEAERFDEALNYSFNKNKKHFKIDGFRAGMAPRALVEKMYGEQILFEDAADYLLPDAYAEAVRENNLQVVARPDVDLVQIEKGKSFIFTAIVTLKPEVTLGQYKGVAVEKAEAKATDEEVDEEIKKVAEGNARLVTAEDRPAKLNDIVTIDFEGFMDGVAFPGGKADGFELQLGSKTFIDTFEDQLVGKKVGEDLEVNVTFPKNYNSPELAGKPATFKVVIKEITEKELPTIDDNFAQDVSEFESLEEYKKDIRNKIEAHKQEHAVAEKENKAIRAAVENAKMDIPAAMIENQIDKLVYNFESRIKQNGLSLEQYFQFTGQSVQIMRESLRNEAEEQVKVSLVLDAIVAEEKITVSDKEFDTRLEELANSMNFDVEKAKANLVGDRREEFEDEIKLQKAVDLIVTNAVEK